MKTTLNAIREHAPCADGWKKLLGNLGKSSADDEPLSLLTILDSNGLDDAIWCLRAATGHDKEIRLFAVWCARKVQHLMTAPVFINAMDVAERFANGLATAEELAAAMGAARSAEWNAAGGGAAWNAARDAANDAAWNAARSAAWNAAWGAAWNAAWGAAGGAAWNAAGGAAGGAVWLAAWDAAWDAARSAQKEKFRELIAG